MAHLRQINLKRFLVISGVILFCWTTAGCLEKQKKPESAPAPALNKKISALERQNNKLRRALAARDERVETLEKSLTQVSMQNLKYLAQIKDLERNSDRQQNWLDAAIVEVVRTKARLHSLESKAEAASTVAEAEIAINAVKKRIDMTDEAIAVEISKAEQLLKMSEKEFNSRNFGGALYLANQAKGHVRAMPFQIGDAPETAAIEGETFFAQPLPLKTLKNSNLREGPGLDHKIRVMLQKDSLVMGHAYKDSWIRVETLDGKAGWLFQSLVDSR